ncbi:MAG TPA: hypothetical protein PK307_16310 [Spirochaetota bacterium]|nr:hypothetical protein [Spirochaetota bacterium]HOD13304.1 hypothetical protein [Spirochaetota bacterium]HPN13739.1 hypothetical protein [Spirochaetota bacterium]HQL83765.1 hypothetical protein [Spirochaetota bacterium]
MRKRGIRNFLFHLVAAVCAVLALCHFVWTDARACDVAVVSGKITANGRPLIWKNRDCSANWHQQVAFFPGEYAGPGSYIMVHDYDDVANMNNGTPVNPSGGLNQAGFAIACTSVYEDFMPTNEAININTMLIWEALKRCVTVSDFENLVREWHTWHVGKVISGNFVVIDARGGAALFECYTGSVLGLIRPVQFRKFDANTGRVTDQYGITLRYPSGGYCGYENRANNNSYIFINYGEERKVRADEILSALAGSGTLDYRSVMRLVARDVNGKQIAASSSDSNYSTTYCISRSQTRLALVVDGVNAGDDPHLATFWCNMGEPSIGIFTPYFPHGGDVPYAAYVDDLTIAGAFYDTNDTCLMNRAINRREIYDNLMYESNDGNAVTGIDDGTINKLELAKVQAWTLPLEDIIMDSTEEYLDQLRGNSSLATPENLYDLSAYCMAYGYINYNETSPGLFYGWDLDKPLGLFW